MFDNTNANDTNSNDSNRINADGNSSKVNNTTA